MEKTTEGIHITEEEEDGVKNNIEIKAKRKDLRRLILNFYIS